MGLTVATGSNGVMEQWSNGKQTISLLHPFATPLLHDNTRDCHRAHPFATSDCTESLVRGRFNTDCVHLERERLGDLLLHRTDVRRNSWGFCQQSGVNVHQLRIFLCGDGGDVSQNFNAAAAADRFIRVWKMAANVAHAQSAEDRVGDGVRKDIGIGVAFQSALVWNLDATKNQFASTRQAMRVVANPATERAHNFKSITPLEAIML